MSNQIKDSANRIILWCEQFDKETLKTRKLYILNQMLLEIKHIENECIPKGSEGIVRFEEKERLMKELNIKQFKIKDSEDKDLKKEYKGNFYGSIANKFFESTSQRIQKHFPKYTEKLRNKLMSSGLNIISTTYLSIIIFTSFLLLFIGSAIGVTIFYMNSTYYGLLLGLILSLISILTLNFYPNKLIRNRKHKLEEEYPFIVSHLSALSNSHIHGISLFEILLHSDSYKALNTDLHRITNYVNVFSITLPEALKSIAANNPSNNIKTLFFELAQEYEEKKDPKRFLDSKCKEAINKYKVHKSSPFTKFRNIYSDTLKYFTLEPYMYITFPLAIIILATSLYYNLQLNGTLLLTLIVFNLIIIIPITINIYKNWNKSKSLESQFYFFVRDLHNTKNVLQLNQNYKELDPHVKKLINQYKIGIPLETALQTFSKEINNHLINSSIKITLEAKKHNASIYEVLYQITTSKVIRNSLRVEEI